MNPSATPTDCLCDEQLAALTSGVMAEPELGQVIAHVADCEDCRSLVGDLLAQNTAIPAVIGRYQIEASLGAGGMGVVLRARDPVLQRQVALKMLHANLAAPAHRERMLEEARALAKLSHPNIVPVFDCGDADGEVYLAMELIEGEPMQHWLAQTRKRDARVAVALGVGAALVAVHKAGLLHRDIKPSNVLIRNDVPVVIDFGLVRSALLQPSDAAGLAGTPQWLAPEVIAGAPATAASDQYQWWQLVQLLLPDDSKARSLITRGLAIEPSKRFATMDLAYNALAAAVAPRRRRSWAVAAAIVTVVVAGSGGMVLWQHNRAALPSPVDSCDVTLDAWSPTDQILVTANAAVAGVDIKRAMPAITQRVAAMQALMPMACRATRQAAPDAQASALRTYLCLQDLWHDARVILREMPSHQGGELRSFVDEWATVPAAATCQTSVAAVPTPPVAAVAADVSTLKDGLFQITNSQAQPSERITQLLAIWPRVQATEYARLRGDWHSAYASAAFAQGDYATAKTEIAAAINDGQIAGDDDAIARQLLNRLQLAASSGEADTAALEQHAIAIAGRLRNTATSMQLLAARAMLALARGNGDAALALQTQAVQGYAALTIDANAEHVTLLQNLAGITQQMGGPKAAAPLYEELVTLAQQRFGDDAKEYWETRGARATNYLYAGDMVVAERELLATNAWFERRRPDDNVNLINLASFICELRLEAGDSVRAEKVCRDALERSEATYGPTSARLLWQLQMRARSLMATGNVGAALPLLQRAMKIGEINALSPTEVAASKTYLALAYLQLHRVADAAPLLAAVAAAAQQDPAICTFLNSEDQVPPQLAQAAKACAKNPGVDPGD